MARQSALPEVGCIVEIVRGRDRGQVAVVIGYEGDRFVQLADGARRKSDHPKKKNAMHVRKTTFVATEIATALQENGRIPNSKLRHALHQYRAGEEETEKSEEERSLPNGER